MSAETIDGRPSPVRRMVTAMLALAALALLADAGWIHAKATLAQTLLQRSWLAGQLDGGVHKPWPWADTHAVARLRLARLDVDQIVLAGDSGRSLAFGPGWAEASAGPGGPGTTAISGHRDTHFAWLRQLRVGDVVELESPQGRRGYRISRADVADARRQQLQLDSDVDRLLLVTCWPFDALTTGGPQRYVVTAEACGDCAAVATADTSAGGASLASR